MASFDWSLLLIIGGLVFWLVLNLWLLPKLGVKT
jgi:hypothetical protein